MLTHVIREVHGAPRDSISARSLTREKSMSSVIALKNVVGFFERVAFAVLGFVLMVLGLALGVTMIMLPVGLVIGLTGVAMVIAALFAHFEQP